MRPLFPSQHAGAARAGSVGGGTPGTRQKPWCQSCGAWAPAPRRRAFARDPDGSRCVAILVCPDCDDWYAERQWIRQHWRH